jgi:hypothetical protein
MKNKFSIFSSVFAALTGRLAVGGLEISDTSIRYAVRHGEQWELTGVRLPPGVMERGLVVDHIQFLSAMQALRSSLSKGGLSQKPLPVVLVLSSAPVYTQAFSLQPLSSEKEFSQALDLNLQMVSPIPLDDAFTSSQILTRDGRGGKVEILGAFVQKKYVEELAELAKISGFLPVAIEPKGVSVARSIRGLVPEYSPAAAYVVLVLDSDGLQCVVVRDGWLYFEFPVLWSDLRQEEKDINGEAFRMAVRRAVSQVRNYYEQHWQQPPVAAIYVAGGESTDALLAALQGATELPVRRFALPGQSDQATSWLIAVGAGLRGLVKRSRDEEVSVAGLSAKEEYFRRELINLFDFWQVLAPVVLASLFLFFSMTRAVMSNMAKDLEVKIAQHSNSGPMQEIASISREATEFNANVAAILAEQSSMAIKTTVVERLSKLMSESQIEPWSYTLAGAADKVTLAGSAPTYPQIQQFQRSLSRDPLFSSVDLPIASVRQQEDGSYSFAISFMVSYPAATKASSTTP